MTPTTLLILAVCWTRVIYELRKGNCLPYSLCGSVVKHRSAESEGLRFDSSWGMFSLSYARDETKNTFLFFFTDLKTNHLFTLFTRFFFFQYKVTNCRNNRTISRVICTRCARYFFLIFYVVLWDKKVPLLRLSGVQENKALTLINHPNSRLAYCQCVPFVFSL